MRKGDLIRVFTMNRRSDSETSLGVVLDYRPDVLGGSCAMGCRDRKGTRWMEIVTSPKRGQVLILEYNTGGVGWWDEKFVERVEVEEVTPQSKEGI